MTLGLPGLIAQLVDDARNVARAEIHLVKSRGYDLVRRSRTAIILLVVALLAVFGAVVALMVGLVLQLATLVGGALAGIVVMVAMLVLAGLLGWGALRAFSGPADDATADTTTADMVRVEKVA